MPDQLTLDEPTSPVLSFDPDRADNADLIIDLFRLNYLRDELATYDPTWGNGRFWAKRRPTRLHGTDLNPAKSPTGIGVDMRRTGLPAGCFDVVCIDGPYKLNGTSGGGGPADSDEDYGVEEYASPDDRHRLIMDGMTEANRLLRPPTRHPIPGTKNSKELVGGLQLIKCQDQVNGGHVRQQTRIFTEHAESMGYRYVDTLYMVGYREQPGGRRQATARQNFSAMLVLRKAPTK